MKFNLKKIERNSAVFFLSSIFTLPRTYIVIKLFFLLFYLLIFFMQFKRKKELFFNKKIFIFYGVIIIMGLIWSLVGYTNGGAIVGISDNLRLWVVWSMCYSIVITIFLQQNSLLFFHKAVVVSGILISVINAVGFCDIFYGLNIIPESIFIEMDLRLGFHEGYMHITTENVTSLFFIVPYLITIQFRRDVVGLNNWVCKLSLFLCFLLAMFSGRRALWLCVLTTPFIIMSMSFFINRLQQIKIKFKKITFSLFLIGILGFGFVASSDALDIPTLEHVKEAFSAEDERSIQKGFLIKSFFNYPIFGSGFGVGAGYQRSENRTWLYELTYHQLLFNFGLFGIFCLLFLYVSFFYLIIKNIRINKANDLIPLCILVGITSFAIGSYSNPYFGSFDFLIYIAMVPYLASIRLSNISNNN